MPRGKYTNHKGRSRRFTNPEELEEQRRKDEQEKKWRRTREDESSDEENDEESGPSGDKPKTIKEAGSGSSGSGSSDSDSEDSDDENGKAKGVSNLIQIENPNRVQKKAKKVTSLNTEQSAKPELSRREREEIEKQRAQAHYQKLHAEGKTEQARADLARLAIIKQQREEAAKRRDAEKKRMYTSHK